MNAGDYTFLADFLRKRSGMALAPEKAYLLEARLLPLAASYGIAGIGGLTTVLRRGGDMPMEQAVVEAMTTNETSFFRDGTPFRALADVILPEMIERKGDDKTLRIWSAGCSTGQEAYSIAMQLSDMPMKDWRIRILGTDISAAVVARAKAGGYNQFDVQRGLPAKMLVKYFVRDGESWVLRPEIKSMVTFRQENLLVPQAAAGMFDIIFCRNALMYFAGDERGKVLRNLHAALHRHGVLFVGGAESLLQAQGLFVPYPDTHGVYRKSAES